MSTVVMHNVVSVDGYIADENDEVGPLFEWYFNGDHPLTPGAMDEPARGLLFSLPLFTGVRGRDCLRHSAVRGSNKFAPGTLGWHHAPAGQASSERTPFMSIFPTKILLGTDGSIEAKLAARTAADLAQKTRSELHVVYVGGEGFFETPLVDLATLEPTWVAREHPDLLSDIERTERELLDEEVGQVQAAGGTVSQAHLRMGGAAPEIVAVGEEIGAGLIVIGSRGRGGMRGALMGSVSESVVRHAHCPVLVVREE
jgi:nucleotide-binding universal stress UspA family protein